MSLFKAHRLCGETEGWSCAAREEAGDLVLEWREADTGLVRADGEGGAQAGRGEHCDIDLSDKKPSLLAVFKMRENDIFGKKAIVSNL